VLGWRGEAGGEPEPLTQAWPNQGMELTRETALLMPKPFGVKCVTVVPKYEPNDLETVVGVFCRSVCEVHQVNEIIQSNMFFSKRGVSGL